MLLALLWSGCSDPPRPTREIEAQLLGAISIQRGSGGFTYWLAPGSEIKLRCRECALNPPLPWRVTATLGEQSVELSASLRPQSALLVVRLPSWQGHPLGLGHLELTGDGRQRARWTVRWTRGPEGFPALSELSKAPPAQLEGSLTRLATLPPEAAPWLGRARASLLLRAGRITDAIDARLEAARVAERLGLVSDLARHTLVAAHLALQSGDLPGATRYLELARARVAPKVDPAAQSELSHIEGYLDWQLGRLDEARQGLERAALGFEEIGDLESASISVEALALLLSDLGHHRLALKTLMRYSSTPELTEPSRANLTLNEGWVRLRGATEGHWPLDSARLTRLFGAASKLGSTHFPPQWLSNAEANLAYTAFLSGDLAQARRHLQRAQAHDPSAQGFTGNFIERLLGEITLAEGRPREALTIFESTEANARAPVSGGDCEPCWRAVWGQGRALRRMGKLAEAGAAFQRALAEVERLSRFTSLIEDRGRFRADRHRLVDDALEHYLSPSCDGGRPCLEAAFTLADFAHSASLRDLQAQRRVSALPPEAAARWASALSEARGAAEALRRSAAAADVTPEADRARWRAEHQRLTKARDAAFEAAFAALAQGGSWRPPPSVQPIALQASLADDEALLLITPTKGDWQSFWLSKQGPLEGHTVEEDPLAPWAHKLDGVEHLYVVPGGHPRGFAMATGQPGREGLLLTHTVSFLPHAGWLLQPHETPKGAPVIIADPRGDLVGAAAEGRAVARRLPGARTMRGPAARTPAVLSALAEAPIVHFAGHGALQRANPWEAHLALFDTDRLSLYDILTHPLSARLIYLSGCETGVDDVLLNEELVGLPEAFLAAGARSVVATSRKVQDQSAQAFAEAFYAALGQRGARPAGALREAALALRARGDDHWRAFRLMGSR